MTSAFRKDIWRTITKSRKRFISILVICALGVTMVTGLRASCFDLRNSADAFFDDRRLYDISIQSTLGLTQDDANAIGALEEVEVAEGTWEEDTYTNSGSKRFSTCVKTLSPNSINEPYMLSGTLPTAANEVAVTQGYLDLSGASIGDTVTLEESDNAVFERTEYTIVGCVIDPAELTNPTGPIAIRASASPDSCLFVTPEAVTQDARDTYTTLYVVAAGAAGLSSYSSEYDTTINELTDRIESLRSEREQARTDQIKQDAYATIDDQEAEAHQEFDDAEAQLANAQAKIDNGWAELTRNQEKIASGKDEIAAGEAQIEQQAAQLSEARAQIEAGRGQIADARAQISAGRTQINSACDASLTDLEQALAAGIIDQATYDAGVAQVEQERTAQLAVLDQQSAALDASEEELDVRAAQIKAGETQLASARQTLAASKQELINGEAQLNSGKTELHDGQAELDSQRQTYETSKADALSQIAQAREEVTTLESAQWYIQSRDANAGFNSVKSDASSIEAIGLVFPVIFIIVAVLIALTTITRMVEEERGLIGTYKSLGYHRKAILAKYVVYALSACIIGGLIGEVCGFVLFPMFLFTVFEVMYQLPTYLYSFDWAYGIGSVLFFIAGIAGAAVLACRAELKETPAALLRPKAPRAGSRILLERISFIWKRMSFLNKVTARNIFRYKKRFLMTVFGIMGCMALLICGFAIRDSVHALSPMQYEDINRYDVLAVVNQSDYDESLETLEADARIAALQPLSIDNITLSSTDDSISAKESLQLFVVPDGASLEEFVNLRTDADSPCTLTNDGVLITRNAAELLGVQSGGSVHIETSTLSQTNAPVANVVDNYLGNAAYITQSTYARLFGTEADLNGFYLNLASDESTAQTAFADELASRDNFMTVTSTQQMNEEFSQSFSLINAIVYVIIVLAAALAFVVLFTLSTTNISERIRELATIKVLGFRRREVNHYVNKETILLTVMGILLGLPAGYAFSNSLTYVLKMPSIYFAVTIEPLSYVFAAALTLLFAWIVARLSNRALAKINMIEALKSVE